MALVCVTGGGLAWVASGFVMWGSARFIAWLLLWILSAYWFYIVVLKLLLLL